MPDQSCRPQEIGTGRLKTNEKKNDWQLDTIGKKNIVTEQNCRRMQKEPNHWLMPSEMGGLLKHHHQSV